MRTLLVLSLAAATVLSQDFTNFEAPLVHPIRLSPSGTKLLVCDPVDHRLAVWSLQDPSHPVLVTEISTGLCPVSVTPRTEDEVWVTCWLSDTVSVISLSAGRETASIRVQDEPTDVAFAGGRAFVAASASDKVLAFDAVTLSALGSIAINAKDPRSLAVDPTGTKVYVLSARSGNKTTIVKNEVAPAPPAPTNGSLPTAPPQGVIVTAGNPAFPQVTWTLPDDDLFEINATTLTVTRTAKSVGTINYNMAVHPSTGEVFVANTDAKNLVRFEPSVRGHVIDSRMTRVVFGSPTTVTPHDLNPSVSYVTLPSPASLSVAISEPTDIAIDAQGAALFIAGFGTDRVAVTDLAGNVLARIEMGTTSGSVVNSREKRGPRALAFQPSTARLYVYNALSRSLGIIDTTTRTLIGETPLGGYDPTPPAIKAGRRFFYDAKLSGNGTASCASCHVDGEVDGLAWDLGDRGGVLQLPPIQPFPFSLGLESFHPMKGPMTTQTFRGLTAGVPLHWRGDRATFGDFNPAFTSLLGGPALSAPDLADFTTFATSIAFPPNPNQRLDRSFATTPAGANAAAGRNAFLNQGFINLGSLGTATCVTCHSSADGGGPFVVSKTLMGTPQQFRPPQLRNLYRKQGFTAASGASKAGFGFNNEGSDGTLIQFLARSQFNNFPSNLKDDVAAFLLAFDTGTAPGVGYRVRLNSTTAALSATTSDLNVLIARAAASDFDLVAHGDRFGDPLDWLYVPSSGIWTPDKSGIASMTHAAFVAAAASGNQSVVVTGVPFMSGTRAALNRDRDAFLDHDELPANYGVATAGSFGTPTLIANTEAVVGELGFAVSGIRAPSAAPGYLIIGVQTAAFPIAGITLNVDVFATPPLLLAIAANSLGESVVPLPLPNDPAIQGLVVFSQLVWADPGLPGGLSASRGLRVEIY